MIRKLFYRLFLFFAPLSVLAEAGGTGGTGGAGGTGNTDTGGGTTALTNPLGPNTNTISDVLNNIIDFLLKLAVPIAVIMTVYVAYLFITAGENQKQVETARKTLLYIVIGVIILILSKGVAVFTKSLLAPLGG